MRSSRCGGWHAGSTSGSARCSIIFRRGTTCSGQSSNGRWPTYDAAYVRQSAQWGKTARSKLAGMVRYLLDDLRQPDTAGFFVEFWARGMRDPDCGTVAAAGLPPPPRPHPHRDGAAQPVDIRTHGRVARTAGRGADRGHDHLHWRAAHPRSVAGWARGRGHALDSQDGARALTVYDWDHRQEFTHRWHSTPLSGPCSTCRACSSRPRRPRSRRR